jgi:hypothetical protein
MVVTAFTVKLAVAPVVVSVMTSTHAVDPHVKVAVAVVFEVTVGEPILSPVQVPVTVPTVNVGADTDQMEFVPLKVIVPWQDVLHPPLPGAPEAGVIVKDSVATDTLVLTESVVSVMVDEPVPELVVTVTVSVVEEVLE